MHFKLPKLHFLSIRSDYLHLLQNNNIYKCKMCDIPQYPLLNIPSVSPLRLHWFPVQLIVLLTCSGHWLPTAGK